MTDINRQLSIGKNNVVRILTALEAKGRVQQDDATKKYGLTGAIAGAALKALSQLDIHKVSLPFLHHLQTATGEASGLCIRVNLQRMFISSVPSIHEVRQVVPLGDRLDLWYGTGGKIMLAFLTAEEIDAVISKRKESADASKPVSEESVTALREELDEIRMQGFALVIGQRNPAICAVAAQIFDHNQKVTGSLGVSGPLPRFNLELARQHSALVMEGARKISTQLGTRL